MQSLLMNYILHTFVHLKQEVTCGKNIKSKLNTTKRILLTLDKTTTGPSNSVLPSASRAVIDNNVEIATGGDIVTQTENIFAQKTNMWTRWTK